MRIEVGQLRGLVLSLLCLSCAVAITLVIWGDSLARRHPDARVLGVISIFLILPTTALTIAFSLRLRGHNFKKELALVVVSPYFTSVAMYVLGTSIMQLGDPKSIKSMPWEDFLVGGLFLSYIGFHWVFISLFAAVLLTACRCFMFAFRS